jgi:creatinine amidohydrolase
MLPAVPYGFRRRDASPLGALAVAPGLFRRALRGILRGLTAQGFGNIIVLDAHRAALQLKGPGLRVVRAKAQPGEDSPWPEDLSSRVAVISTGQIEQHGHHLPTSTDNVIAQALAEGLAAAQPQAVFCLPIWPYGVSTHSRQFAATLNLGGRVFEDFLLAIAGRLIHNGAEMVYFSNAHGGNHSHLVNVVKRAGERWPQAFVATEWLHTTGPSLELLRQSGQGGMGHGGELETSYLLHLRPDLVRMDLATTETDFISTSNFYMDWIEAGRLIANPPWTDDTTSGIYGDSTLGTADKGRSWLQSAIAERVESMEEIRQQHARRTARRRRREDAAGPIASKVS